MTTVDSVKQLRSLEKAIQNAGTSWLRVAEALTVIHENRLYRTAAGYETFADYLEQALEMSRQFGYDHLHACAVVKNVRTIRTWAEPRLAHAVELYGLPSDVQVGLVERISAQHIPILQLRQMVHELKRTRANGHNGSGGDDKRALLRVVGGTDWQIDHADAAEPACAPESLDLQVTSPPYCVGPWDARLNYLDYSDYADYRDRLMSTWARAMHRVAAPHGRLALIVAIDITRPGRHEPLAVDWFNALVRAGWSYRHWIHWWEGNINDSVARGTAGPSAPNVISPVEAVMVFHKGDQWSWREIREQHPEWSERDLTDGEWIDWTMGAWTLASHDEPDPEAAVNGQRWTIAGQRAAELDGFPAAYPPELIRRLVKIYSYPRSRVGDLFLGSGTTGEVAIAHDRHFYGSDLSPRWVEFARRRIAATARLRMASSS